MKKSTLPFSLLALLTLGLDYKGISQNVAINTSGNSAYTGAILDLSNHNTIGAYGFLPPYVSLTDATVFVNPIVGGTAGQLSGLLVYNTSASLANGLSGPGLYYWNNTLATPSWVFIGSGATTIGGAGTLNYLSRWTPNGSTLGIGITQDNGVEVGITTGAYAFTPGNPLLDVTGNASNVTAILGTTAQPTGYGVKGTQTATTGTTAGVYGSTASSAGFGAEGINLATSGTPIGVYGEANGSGATGIGVEGSSNVTGGIGVEGFNNNAGASGGYGVQGLISGNGGGFQYGVYGASTVTGGNSYGVFGSATGTGAAINYGGYFTATGAINNYGLVVPNNGGFTGLYTTTPVNTLDVFGSVGTQISAGLVTSNVTLDGTYSTILANPTGGAFTITLPTAGATNIRRYYTIVYSPSVATANAVTIQVLAGSIYTGSVATMSISLTAGSVTLQSNGNNWYTTNNWNGLTPITGAGTLNYLARWTPTGTQLGIGITQDNGTTVGINNAPVATQMLTTTQANAANIAILGQNTSGAGSGAGIGLEGTTAQSGGYGVYGLNTAIAAGAIGIYGLANGAGSAGIGVKGNSTVTGGTGVEGINNNTGVSGGYGVQGLISGNGGGFQYGIYGSSTVTAGNGFGVYGQATGTGAGINYGGYFSATNGTNNYGVVVPAGGGNSGFGTIAPVSTLDVSGSYGVGTTMLTPAASTTTALGGGYSTVLATPTAISTTYTLTLPSAAANSRRIYTIVYYGSGLGNIDITSPVSGSIMEDGAVVATLGLSQGSVTLQSDGTNWDVLNTTTTNTYGSFVGIKYITTTTAAVAFDAGTNSILVKVIGGGGAGSGGSTLGTCNNTDIAGTGGGAGGYVEGFVNNLTGSSTFAVTIGAGGVGSAACNSAGGNGGNTVLTLTNPAVTFTGNGGVGGPSNETNGADSYKIGGAGGTATSTAAAGSYITITGATGGAGLSSNAGIHLMCSGPGAGTTFGPGGSAISGRQINEPGIGAVAFGAGGGGAIIAQVTTTEAGGNGHQGVVIIYEYQ